MVGRCISYWNSPFLGDMLVFQGVNFQKSMVCFLPEIFSSPGPFFWGPGNTRCVIQVQKTLLLGGSQRILTWMSRWKLGSNGLLINGSFHRPILYYNGVYWGYNPLILTIDPNFLGHPSRVGFFFCGQHHRLTLGLKSWWVTPSRPHTGQHDGSKKDRPLGGSSQYSQEVHPWKFTWNIITEGLVQIIFLSFHGWWLAPVPAVNLLFGCS